MAASEDHDEQQRDEVEALEMIFEDKLTITKADAPRIIDIRLCPLPDEGEEANHVAVTLRMVHTASYPDSGPILELHDVKGLSDVLQEELLRVGRSSAEEMEGMPVGMAVAEAVREWLEEHNEPPSDGSMYAQMMDREKRRLDESRRATAKVERRAAIDAEFEASRAKAGIDRHMDHESLSALAASHGTPVTAETFAAWRAAFAAEVSERALASLEAASGKGGAAAASASAAVAAAAAGPLGGPAIAVEGMGAIGMTLLLREQEAAVGKSGRELFQDSSTIRAAEADEVAAAAAALRAGEAEDAEDEAAAAAAAAAIGDAAVFLDDDEDLSDLDDEAAGAAGREDGEDDDADDDDE